jgi:hypothetical protein
LPESKEAYGIMAGFFNRHLGVPLHEDSAGGQH